MDHRRFYLRIAGAVHGPLDVATAAAWIRKGGLYNAEMCAVGAQKWKPVPTDLDAWVRQPEIRRKNLKRWSATILFAASLFAVEEYRAAHRTFHVDKVIVTPAGTTVLGR